MTVSSITELQAKIKLARARFQKQPESRVFAPLADLLREAGQYREALLILDRGLRQYPRYVTGQVIKGRTLIEAGYGSLGQASLEKALEIDPHNILALDLLVGEATSRKAWMEVLGPLEKMVALEPEDEKLVIFLAKVRQKLVEKEPAPEVREDYREVVAKPISEIIPEPGNIPKVSEVEVTAEPVARQKDNPDTPVFEPASFEEPVVEEGTSAVEALVPGASHVTMTMVDIYLAQGYREMAITALEEILAANPGRQDVQIKLDGLRDDPSCGIPASRKEKLDSTRISVSKKEMSEQRKRDKEQFTKWIAGVSDKNRNADGGGSI